MRLAYISVTIIWEETITLVDYRKFLRLKSLGYTMKDIASCIYSSRNTVFEVLNLTETLQLTTDDVTKDFLR